MKEIDLYRFVRDNDVEYHWHDGDVILMPSCNQVEEFNKLLPQGIYDDDGVECIMKNGYFCFMMEHICSYCGIELFDIFPDETNR